MDWQLDAAEVRVLGALMEKEITTPDYYPLSVNALVNACNQKSNREPVVSYDEDMVETTLDGLRAKGLASRISGGAKDEGMQGGAMMLGHFNLGEFLSSPGLWIGLALTAAFLAGAVRLRRDRGPI